MSVKKSKGEAIFDILNYIFMCFCIVAFIYPFWQELVLSLSTTEEALAFSTRLFPKKVTFESYKRVFKSDLIFIGYYNTIIRTSVGTILTVIVTYFAAYGLSKKELPFRNLIITFITFTMFFSGGLIPKFLLIRDLGLMGSRWALILPGLTSAWNIIIARNFIMMLPKELEESAFVDGARPITTVLKIMIPLSMPIIAVLALWSAVGHWNAWFDAYLYVRQREKMVLQLILRRILIETGRSEDVLKDVGLTTDLYTPETIKAAMLLVSIGPIIMFYPFLQKYFVKGVIVGSLKG